MNERLKRLFDIPFPLFAFSHCRDVVVAVGKAGGFGVLGGSNFTPEQLEVELDWIDRHIDGRPYGVDLLFPENLSLAAEDPRDEAGLRARIPSQHLAFIRGLLERHGLPAGEDPADLVAPPPQLLREQGVRLLEVAFRHPIRLIVNALGLPPPEMFEAARRHGVPVGALAGAREHALRHVDAGVDVIVAQGGEAGGHCGEVSTMVVVPEIVRAVRARRPEVAVLAAGGIVTGRQMAACMALGADGAWTGSVWLSTTESEVSQTFREKMVQARSRDTVRSKGRTGKPSRQLRSAWTDAWEASDSPGALPMPLQSMVSEPALERAADAADKGHAGARELVTYFVGQGVGLVDGIRSARQVVRDFQEEFAEALGDLEALAR